MTKKKWALFINIIGIAILCVGLISRGEHADAFSFIAGFGISFSIVNIVNVFVED